MGNKALGQIDLEIGDKTYILHFSVNAFCLMAEEMKGVDVVKLGDMLESGAVIDAFPIIRKLFWIGLRQHQKGITLEQAGDLIEVAGLAPVAEKTMDALMSARSLDAGRAGPLAQATQNSPATSGSSSTPTGSLAA